MGKPARLSDFLVDRDALTRVGVVLAPHGLAGEIKAAPETETPAYYLDCPRLYVDAPQGLSRYQVTAWRLAGTHWLITLDGVTTRAATQDLIGGELLLEDSQLRPLAPGEYFQHDLLGCRVIDETGLDLGEVTGLMESGAQDLLIVKDLRDTARPATSTAISTDLQKRPRELLLPLVKTIVDDVDLATRTIRARLPPGLLELNH